MSIRGSRSNADYTLSEKRQRGKSKLERKKFLIANYLDIILAQKSEIFISVHPPFQRKIIEDIVTFVKDILLTIKRGILSNINYNLIDV